MKRRQLSWTLVIIIMTITLGLSAAYFVVVPAKTVVTTDPVADPQPIFAQDLKSGGLVAIKALKHENLQVFAIVGEAEINDRTYVTLNEAMKKKWVELKETGNVNQLMINNPSDQYIFIQAGDIVKGGKQDRTLKTDLIIPPQTYKVEISSFCVEQGRWSNRGDEDVANFSYSEKNLSSRDLKFAAKKESNQSSVWQKVEEQQGKLSSNVARKYNDSSIQVQSEVSASSYQLTLENDKLEEFQTEYRKALESILETKDIIGLAYAINGEVYGLDVFNNSQLFRDLSDKLLDAFIIEAIGQMDDEEYEDVTIEQVQTIVQLQYSSEWSNSKTTKLNETTGYTFKEQDLTNLYLTTDLDKKTWLHMNVIIASGPQYDLSYDPRRD